MPTDPPDLVEDLVERCILALDVADHDGCERVLQDQDPAVVAQVRSQLERLSSLGFLSVNRATAIPEQFGEFRLLRQLGRGGMGVVHVAEQTALQRLVALKLVVPEHLFFAGARERFRREVLTIARLQHPGIVPILTCGEVEGVPYYAMELVTGASLAEILQELAGSSPSELDGGSLRAALRRVIAHKGMEATVVDGAAFSGAWPQVCCRLVLDVAEALQHAHERGVLHRDVKPSNLLLTTDGRVRVVDFGLASARGEQRITRSGAAFGSLPYMSPEQVRGDLAALDARTDIYALGVTLYEMLTLTLPHGDGSGTTRERILAGHVDPPTARNAKVHPDIEAVCLLAMDVDPSRRYADMNAFAADLRAFLELRTVRARRPGPWLRARRWAMRRPGRAAALAVAFLALVPTPLLFATQQHFATERIAAALLVAEREQQRAERNLEAALAAIDRMLTRTATGELSRHPRTVKLRRSLLEDAITLYDLLAESARDAGGQLLVRIEAAKAAVRVGSLHMELGDHRAALARLEDAVAVFDEAVAADLNPANLQFELGNGLRRLGDVLMLLDRVDDSVRTLSRGRDVFVALAKANPDSGQAAGGLLSTRLRLALTLSRQGKPDAGHLELDAAEQMVMPDLPPTVRDDVPIQLWLAAAYCADARGTLFSQGGETELAAQAFARAARLIEALPRELQSNDAARQIRLGVLERLGKISLQRREWDQAEPWLDLATEELEQRVAEEPEIVDWRARLADMLGSRASNRSELGQLEGALADHDRAIALLEQVVREAPNDSQQRCRLAIAHAERAGRYAGRGDFAAAVGDLTVASETLTAVLAVDSSDRMAKANLAAVYANLARVQARMGDFTAARGTADRAIELALTRTVGENERSLVELYGLASDLAMQAFDIDAGRVLIQQAQERADAWLAKRPDDPLRLGTAAMIGVNRGTMHLQMREHAAAIAAWEQALPIARRAAASSPFGKRSLAICLMRLADVHVRDGDFERAREWFAAALRETDTVPATLVGMDPLVALFEHPELQSVLERERPAGARRR